MKLVCSYHQEKSKSLIVENVHFYLQIYFSPVLLVWCCHLWQYFWTNFYELWHGQNVLLSRKIKLNYRSLRKQADLRWNLKSANSLNVTLVVITIKANNFKNERIIFVCKLWNLVSKLKIKFKCSSKFVEHNLLQLTVRWKNPYCKK